jgi:hypothetical protein
MAASWWLLQAIEGFALDMPSNTLVLAPTLPAGWKSLSAPLFAPTFWGWMEYRPSPRGATLEFRLDRFLPTAAPAPRSSGAANAPVLAFNRDAAIVVKRMVLPNGAGPIGEITASLGRSPLPGKLSRDSRNRPVFTFDNPPALLAGQRIVLQLAYGTSLSR